MSKKITTHLFNDSYEPMDAIPPVYKENHTTTICTDAELKEGAFIQWYAQRRVKPFDHQWYQIVEVVSKDQNKKQLLGKFRYQLVVEPAEITDKEAASLAVLEE